MSEEIINEEQIISNDVNTEESSVSEEKKVPYYRFQEVINEKNKLAETAQKLLEQNLEFQRKNSESENKKEELTPELSTIPELVGYLKNEVNKIIEEKITPIQNQTVQQAYSTNIERFFNSNPDAENIKNEINDYTANLSVDRKRSLVQSIAKGDLSGLDEIYWTITARKNNQSKTLINSSINSDKNKVFSPQATRSIKSGQPSNSELIEHGAKTGDFSHYFRRMAEKV